MRGRCVWIALLFLGGPSVPCAARAQGLAVSAGVVGTAITQSTDFWGREFQSVGLAIGAIAPLGGRFSLVPFATYANRRFPLELRDGTPVGVHIRRSEGLFGVLVEQRLRKGSSPRRDVFVNYGIAGHFYRENIPAHDVVFASGQISSRRASTTRSSSFPVFAVLGLGVHKPIGSHLSLRATADSLLAVVVPVGVRFTGSLVVSAARR